MRRIALGTLALLLPALLLAACGGGDGSPPPAQGLRLDVQESTATTFRATVRFGPAKLTTRDEMGETFTMVGLDGCHPVGADDGTPGVPVVTRLLAVPQGARVVVSEVVPVVSRTLTLLLYPYQAQAGDYSPEFERPGPYPSDAEDWMPPFAFDTASYDGAAALPPNPCVLSPVFPARDLRLVVLQIACGAYVPETRELTLYSRVDLTLSFEGGTGMFLGEGAGNPFEAGDGAALGVAWNHDAVEPITAFPRPSRVLQGEELLILTPPDYRDAADRLAAHKNALGLLTHVVTVNDGVGAGGPDTKEEIKTFLDTRYDNAVVRFSYLLLLGDAQDIEPFVLPRRYKVDDFPSDFPYAQIHTDPLADDLIPAVAVGRISVDSLAEANTVVDKIVQYETDPPHVFVGGTFYRHAAIASYFQPGENGNPANVENLRRFVQDSEEIRTHMVNEGFDVQRIYTATLPLTPENTPRYYNDGTTPLPAPLRPEDNYPWDGDAQQIIDAFAAGKCLLFHVDHGWPGGWGAPAFNTTHLPLLTNGELLPLVLSANCSSGAFDYVDAGFAESILRMSGGGAIGVMAFTRNSNNYVGRQFVIGVVDALWPSAYPDFGDDQQRPRLGDMLNHARGLMTTDHVGGDPTSNDYLGAWCYERMLTLFGDPSLAVRTESPFSLPLYGHDRVIGPVIDLVYPYAGATITVFEQLPDGVAPIGRATAGPDGAVHIEPIADVVDADNLLFYASAPGAIPTPVEVTAGP